MRRDFLLALVSLCALSACGGGASTRTDPGDTAEVILLPPGAAESSLHLVGELKGPGMGLGPEVAFEAWIRADRWMRADLRFEREDGSPAHEVLVWGPDTCLLFDRQRGRYTQMGDEPGSLELEQGSFRVQHAIWLALGRWVGEQPLPGRWEDGEWRGRDEGLGLRAGAHGEKLGWTELVWRGERMRGEPKQVENSAWGAVPRRIELSGSLLESVVKAEWSVESIPAFGDELLDPLMDP